MRSWSCLLISGTRGEMGWNVLSNAADLWQWFIKLLGCILIRPFSSSHLSRCTVKHSKCYIHPSCKREVVSEMSWPFTLTSETLYCMSHLCSLSPLQQGMFVCLCLRVRDNVELFRALVNDGNAPTRYDTLMVLTKPTQYQCSLFHKFNICIPHCADWCCHDTKIINSVRYLPKYLNTDTETIPRQKSKTSGKVIKYNMTEDET